jgi:hypothetical protein
MAACVNYHRIASDCYSSNTCNVGGRLRTVAHIASDADGVCFASNTVVADIDIVVACGKPGTGKIP